MWPKLRRAGLVLLFLAFSAYYFLSTKQQQPAPQHLQIAAKVNPPTQPILFQPAFLWQDSNDTRQGTGFFTRTTNGQTIGITSSHFIRFDGPVLKKAAWLHIRTKEPVTKFSKSFGIPGNGGSSDFLRTDLRSDYLLLLADNPIDEKYLLELDEREMPQVGEPICFPNKNSNVELGFILVSGHVSAVHTGYITINLDQSVAMQSQSGSPIISLMNGKVIGTLSRSVGKESTILNLTPASAILQAIKNTTSFPSVEEVIGKTKK